MRSISLLLLGCCFAVSVSAEAPPAPPATKVIREVRVHISEIFEGDQLSWIYRTANKAKIQTRTEVVRQELLFDVGDRYDKFVIAESERTLRLLPFLRNAQIQTREEGDFVDVDVYVQDTWTFIPQTSYSSGSGSSNYSIGLSETNLLGFGKRFEVLYGKDEDRTSTEAVWDDSRVWGTRNRFLGAYFHRDDGDRAILLLTRPFRSLVEKRGWSIGLDRGDTVGRLFENGDERFIFRQQNDAYQLRYTFADGDPEVSVHRISFGYDYLNDDFSEATLKDFRDLNIDPNSVTHDPRFVPENRRFTGPAIGYQKIDPDYLTLDYIDRFERVQDFNLGSEYSVSATLAADVLGSFEDTALLSGVWSRGHRFSNDSFVRGELGVASRYHADGFDNSLFRLETKYYDVLGEFFAGDVFLGKHTLAAAFSVDYGVDLDRDREFLLGADTGLRGYEAKTFTGDKRFVLNIEDRVHLVENIFDVVSLGAAVFADVGGSTTEPLTRLYGDHLYADVGIGLRFAFPSSSGGRVLRVDLAIPLRDGPDGSGQFEPRLVLAGGQIFSSRLKSEVSGAERANVEVGYDR